MEGVGVDGVNLEVSTSGTQMSTKAKHYVCTLLPGICHPVPFIGSWLHLRDMWPSIAPLSGPWQEQRYRVLIPNDPPKVRYLDARTR